MISVDFLHVVFTQQTPSLTQAANHSSCLYVVSPVDAVTRMCHYVSEEEHVTYIITYNVTLKTTHVDAIGMTKPPNTEV